MFKYSFTFKNDLDYNQAVSLSFKLTHHQKANEEICDLFSQLSNRVIDRCLEPQPLLLKIRYAQLRGK